MAQQDNEDLLAAFAAFADAVDNNAAHHPAYHPAFGKEPRINDRRFINRSNRTDEPRPMPNNRRAGVRNTPKQGARRPGGYENFDRWLQTHKQPGTNKIPLADIHHENINFLHHGQNTHSFLRPLISYSEKNATGKSCAYGTYKDGDRYRCIKNPDHHTKIRRFGPAQRAIAAPAPAIQRRVGAIPAPTMRRSARLANKNK